MLIPLNNISDLTAAAAQCQKRITSPRHRHPRVWDGRRASRDAAGETGTSADVYLWRGLAASSETLNSPGPQLSQPRRMLPAEHQSDIWYFTPDALQPRCCELTPLPRRAWTARPWTRDLPQDGSEDVKARAEVAAGEHRSPPTPLRNLIWSDVNHSAPGHDKESTCLAVKYTVCRSMSHRSGFKVRCCM